MQPECRSTIAAMLAVSKSTGGKRSLSPLQIVTSLYLQVLGFGVGCFLFGMTLITLARETGRGDPYHMVGVDVFALVVVALGIIAMGITFHFSLRRLLSATNAK
jgi:hypothetical protein